MNDDDGYNKAIVMKRSITGRSEDKRLRSFSKKSANFAMEAKKSVGSVLPGV